MYCHTTESICLAFVCFYSACYGLIFSSISEFDVIRTLPIRKCLQHQLARVHCGDVLFTWEINALKAMQTHAGIHFTFIPCTCPSNFPQKGNPLLGLHLNNVFRPGYLFALFGLLSTLHRKFNENCPAKS